MDKANDKDNAKVNLNASADFSANASINNPNKSGIVTLTLGILLLLLAITFAWLQPAHPDPTREIGKPILSKLDDWLYPIEVNGFTQNLSDPASLNLNNLHVSKDGRQLWAVGDLGLVLHSEDAGRSWQKKTISLQPKPTPTANWGWINSAVAGEPPTNAYGNAAPVQQPILSKEQMYNQQQQAIPDWQQLKNQSNQMQQAPVQLQQQEVPEPKLTKLLSVFFINDARGWIVGDKGLILSTEDGGTSWKLQQSRTSATLYSVTFIDEKTGWAAGADGVILATNNGGQSWVTQTSGTSEWLYCVIFLNDTEGWAVGRAGTILVTQDRGQNWHQQTVKDASLYFSSVFFVNEQQGWIVGENGTILVTRDGGQQWNLQKATIPDSLESVAFADTLHGWAVGARGILLRTRDGGENWLVQQGFPVNDLRSVTIADADKGWVAGLNGALLWTDNGGLAWHPVAYAIYPAPWIYVLLFVSGILIWYGLRDLTYTPTSDLDPRPGIVRLFVTDEPLDSKAKDYLGHDSIVKGLANFILNRNTSPSLTMAVTGSWGGGKSSIMRRLEQQLRDGGFRPVWFNAWHHQQEGRQLASMLNSIREQAVPVWYSPAGWWVRASLYWRRGWQYRLLFCAILALIFLVATDQSTKELHWSDIKEALYVQVTGVDNREISITPGALEKLRKDAVLDKHALQLLATNFIDNSNQQACRTVDGNCRFTNIDQLYLSLEKLMQPDLLSDEEKSALQTVAHHQGARDVSLMGVSIAFLIPLLFGLVGKGTAVYGLKYLDIVKNLLPGSSKVEGKEDVGTIEHFRKEFCLLTQALDQRLVLFIDDLDRCDCTTVREVLELVNYLTSVGKCFMVLGMAMEHVSPCIPPRNGEAGNNNHASYARQYLKKLINIEVPVPTLQMEKSQAMLMAQANEKPPSTSSETLLTWARHGLHLAFVLLVSWSMVQSWQWLYPIKPLVAPKEVVDTLTASPTDTVGVAPLVQPGPYPRGQVQGDQPDLLNSPNQTPAQTPFEKANRARFMNSLMLLVMLFITALLFWYKRKQLVEWLHSRGWATKMKVGLGGAVRTQDSDDFVQALDIWREVILIGDPTPRGIKRFVNRVRFFSMMEQAQKEDQIPDMLLVALAALHHNKSTLTDAKLPDNAADLELHSTWDKSEKSENHVSEKNLYGAIERATKQMYSHGEDHWPPTPVQWQRFRSMVENMHVH